MTGANDTSKGKVMPLEDYFDTWLNAKDFEKHGMSMTGFTKLLRVLPTRKKLDEYSMWLNGKFIYVKKHLAHVKISDIINHYNTMLLVSESDAKVNIEFWEQALEVAKKELKELYHVYRLEEARKARNNLMLHASTA